jgi:hypothetical protein
MEFIFNLGGTPGILHPQRLDARKFYATGAAASIGRVDDKKTAEAVRSTRVLERCGNETTIPFIDPL